jgi:hypothetical protein
MASWLLPGGGCVDGGVSKTRLATVNGQRSQLMGAAEAWETRPLSHLKDKLALEKPGFLVLAALWVGGRIVQDLSGCLCVAVSRATSGEYVNRYTRCAFMYIGSGGWMLERGMDGWGRRQEKGRNKCEHCWRATVGIHLDGLAALHKTTTCCPC